MGRPPIQLPRVTFRFPEELRDRLQSSATSNGRSLNEEVVARLEKSFVLDEDDFMDRSEASAIIREEVKRLTDAEFDSMRKLSAAAQAIIDQWNAERIERERIRE